MIDKPTDMPRWFNLLVCTLVLDQSSVRGHFLLSARRMDPKQTVAVVKWCRTRLSGPVAHLIG